MSKPFLYSEHDKSFAFLTRRLTSPLFPKKKITIITFKNSKQKIHRDFSILLKSILLFIFLLSFSEFSAKLILQRDNTLPLKNEAILRDGALIYDSTKKDSPVPKSNDSKIFVVKGTIVSNLGNQTNAEVVFINQSKLSQPLRVKNKKKHASKPKIKGKVEKKFRITKDIGKTFDDPPSDSQFSYRSSSKAFALLSNFNSPSKKLISVGSFYARAKFCFSISGKSNLEFYLQNKPFFRFLHSLRTRPPPYFTLS